MEKEIQILDAPNQTRLRMHPKKFAMWIFLVSVIMLFAALTSAYIVRQSEGNWFVFDLPPMFFYSTGVILLSSVTMQMAYMAGKKDNFFTAKLALIGTTVLGIAFLVMQLLGWQELVELNVFFVGNPSGSFVYVISGLHAVHLISAVIFLVVMVIFAFRYKIHSKSMLSLDLCNTYWHFLDALWIYLFIFMLINR